MPYSALFKRIDNTPLILFRIIFGLLMAWHSIKCIYDGTVTKLYITPKFLFPFIGFEWLKPLPGNGMFWYFGLMALASVLVAVGLFYRFSLLMVTLLFTGTYLMQKTIYNNHHYLIILLCVLLLCMPANRYVSADVLIKPSLQKYSMPQWCRWIIIFQVWVVYTFAAVAKLYPTWLDGTFTGILMSIHRNPVHSFISQNHYFHLFLAWSGILFDLLIVPLLLYKRTRIIGTLAMIFFHLFNSYALTIGIFPFLALSLIIFFYPPDVLRKWLFWQKKEIPVSEFNLKPGNINLTLLIIAFYATIQLLLPLRHYAIPGNIMYTEEGHRMSWRMKLSQKRVRFKMYVKENGSNSIDSITLKKYFTKPQLGRFPSRPDMIWQAVQYVKQDYAKQGKTVALYASAKVTLNNLPERQIIDTATNLAEVKWNPWNHSVWVLKNDE